jgi:hypothetical protein
MSTHVNVFVENLKFFRFVDHDMYMRYIGGGVCHSFHYVHLDEEDHELETIESDLDFGQQDTNQEGDEIVKATNPGDEDDMNSASEESEVDTENSDCSDSENDMLEYVAISDGYVSL